MAQAKGFIFLLEAVLYESMTYSNLVMWLSVGLGCLFSLALGIFIGSRLCPAKSNRRHTLSGTERDSLIRANSINRESEIDSASNFEEFVGDPFAPKGKDEGFVTLPPSPGSLAVWF